MVLKYWRANEFAAFYSIFNNLQASPRVVARSFLTETLRAVFTELTHRIFRNSPEPFRPILNLPWPAPHSPAGPTPICAETPSEFRRDPSKTRPAFAEYPPPAAR